MNAPLLDERIEAACSQLSMPTDQQGVTIDERPGAVVLGAGLGVLALLNRRKKVEAGQR